MEMMNGPNSDEDENDFAAFCSLARIDLSCNFFGEIFARELAQGLLKLKTGSHTEYTNTTQ